MQSIISGSQGDIEMALYATDAAAFESNLPKTIPDDGGNYHYALLITRAYHRPALHSAP